MGVSLCKRMCFILCRPNAIKLLWYQITFLQSHAYLVTIKLQFDFPLSSSHRLPSAAYVDDEFHWYLCNDFSRWLKREGIGYYLISSFFPSFLLLLLFLFLPHLHTFLSFLLLSIFLLLLLDVLNKVSLYYPLVVWPSCLCLKILDYRYVPPCLNNLTFIFLFVK